MTKGGLKPNEAPLMATPLKPNPCAAPPLVFLLKQWLHGVPAARLTVAWPHTGEEEGASWKGMMAHWHWMRPREPEN